MRANSPRGTLRVHEGLRSAVCRDKGADMGILISFRFSSLNTMTVFNDKWHDRMVRAIKKIPERIRSRRCIALSPFISR